jgi:hypothetical protein
MTVAIHPAVDQGVKAGTKPDRKGAVRARLTLNTQTGS